MLCFWVINSARLLGIKHYQKALGLRVASSGKRLLRGPEQQTFHKGFQASLWGLAVLTALLQRSHLIPSLTAGWWACFCTHKGKPHLEGMKPGPLSAQLQFLYKFCWMMATYQLDMGKNHRRKRGFPPLSSFPHRPRRNVFCVKIQFPALLENTVVFGQNILEFFNFKYNSVTHGVTDH